MGSGTAKSKRLEKVKVYIEENPFTTDEELARIFSVSIQTIRLDRLELGIPELRERVKRVAEKSYAELKSLQGSEIIGDLIDLELDHSGISALDITEEMVFKKNGIARGHFLFAQVNSLAVACVNAEAALTGTAKIAYKNPVKLNQKVVAKAQVTSQIGSKYRIDVKSKVGQEVVLEGTFVIFAVTGKEDYEL